MWRGLIAWSICFVLTIAISLVTKPKPESELKGLVYGLTAKADVGKVVWYKRPVVLAIAALILFALVNIIFF